MTQELNCFLEDESNFNGVRSLPLVEKFVQRHKDREEQSVKWRLAGHPEEWKVGCKGGLVT